MTPVDALRRFALRFACHQPKETPEMTETTSRPASGTDQDQRVCVTCEQPIAQAPTSEWYHLDIDWKSLSDPSRQHDAQPRPVHPADSGNPFAGIPGADGDETDEFLAGLTAAVDAKRDDRDLTATAPTPVTLQPVEHDQHDHDFADCPDPVCRQHRDTAARWTNEQTFPTAEPEPSISLNQFQQRVANGDWNGTKPAPVAPRPHQQSSYGLAILAALGKTGRHVYAGTVDHATKQTRRTRNRAARRSRRINRGR